MMGGGILPEGLALKVSKRIASLHHFLFWLFSFGRFSEYQVICGGKVVAFAQVSSRIFIFGFMPRGKNTVHIGPCYTQPDFRRKGLYSFLLASICSDFSENEKYIFCHKENMPSKRGILKAGFVPFAEGYKSKIGIYKINRYL